MSQSPNSTKNLFKNRVGGKGTRLVPAALKNVSPRSKFNELVEDITSYISLGLKCSIGSIVGAGATIYSLYQRPELDNIFDVFSPPALELLVSKFWFKKALLYQISDSVSNFNSNAISSIVQRQFIKGDIRDVKNTVIRNGIQLLSRQLLDPTSTPLTTPNYDALLTQLITNNVYGRILKPIIF